MQRTWVGLGFGGACGLTIGVGIVIGFGGWGQIETDKAAIVGAIMAAAGSTAGAIVGGVADILAALRAASGKPTGTPSPEAEDYRDQPAG